MKKLIYIHALLILIFIPSIGKNPSQKSNLSKFNHTLQLFHHKDTIDLTALYFWYYIKFDHNINLKEYKLKKVKNKITSGTIFEYERLMWINLIKGKYFIIGPFYTLYDAKFSRDNYKMVLSNSNPIEESSYKEYFWWSIKINPKWPRQKYSNFFISDFKTNKKTINEFTQIINNFQENNILMIGPYSDYQFISALFKKNYYRAEKADFEFP